MDWSKQFWRYVVLMLLQVLLFNRLQFLGVCHPYIYVLCLLMFPITLPHWVDMVLGAVAGIVMDAFCNSLGVHMSACILIMYLRRYLLGAIVIDKDRLNEQISLRTIDLVALLKYVILLVLVHHLTVFAVAAWSLTHIGFVLLETLVSSAVTIIFIIGYNALKFR